jgi:hypothetical protein
MQTAFFKFDIPNGTFGMAVIWKTKLIGILFLTQSFSQLSSAARQQQQQPPKQEPAGS